MSAAVLAQARWPAEEVYKIKMFIVIKTGFKSPSFGLLILRYILRLGQAAQKQQHPHCPNPKMYVDIRRADKKLS